jgi:hypothetical protein
MVSVPSIAEVDVEETLRVLEGRPEDATSLRVCDAIRSAQPYDISPGGRVRSIQLSKEDIGWLIGALEDFLKHGAPDAERRKALNRMVAKLYAASQSR